MSRKNRRHKIDKSKFKETVCSKCGLCIKGTNPKFCYNFLYKKNPSKFINVVLPKMISQNNFLSQAKELSPNEVSTSMIAMSIFRAIFCTNDLCIGCSASVDQVNTCILKFRTQEVNNPIYSLIKQTFGPKISKIQKKALKKAKKAENKEKNKPKVTIFMSENEEFKSEVKCILENNLKQPDKD